MARRQRRRAARAAGQQEQDQQRRFPRPNVWLATLSTVVATSTGMFALRDYLFADDVPNRPAAPSMVASTPGDPGQVYLDNVALTCRRLAENEQSNAAEFERFKRRLPKFKTGLEERAALLGVVDAAARRHRGTLSTFQGLEVFPSTLKPVARSVAGPWKRNVRRQESYADQLRRADTFGDLALAASRFNDGRPQQRADAARMVRGLVRLTSVRCEPPPPVTVEPAQLLGPDVPGPLTTDGTLSPRASQATLTGSVDADRPFPDPVGVPTAPDATPDPEWGDGPLTDGNPDDPDPGVAPDDDGEDLPLGSDSDPSEGDDGNVPSDEDGGPGTEPGGQDGADAVDELGPEAPE